MVKALFSAPAGEVGRFLNHIGSAKLYAAGLYERCGACAPPPKVTTDMAACARRARTVAARLQGREVFAVRQTLDEHQADRGTPDWETEASRAQPPDVHNWESAVMLAFALDEAADAALVGLTKATDGALRLLAADAMADERLVRGAILDHLVFAVEPDAALGRRLAREMIVARDWIKQVFPRHAALARLTEQGLLDKGATAAHDSYLASLGDEIQEALGVLGDL